MPGKDRRRQRERDKVQRDLRTLPQQELGRLIQTLEEEMHEASADLRFEYAARLRDEIADLRREITRRRLNQPSIVTRMPTMSFLARLAG